MRAESFISGFLYASSDSPGNFVGYLAHTIQQHVSIAQQNARAEQRQDGLAVPAQAVPLTCWDVIARRDCRSSPLGSECDQTALAEVKDPRSGCCLVANVASLRLAQLNQSGRGRGSSERH
jgi:hypothetical protein